MTEKDKSSIYRPDPDSVWKETVNNEIKAVMKWEEEWGFLVNEYKTCQKKSAGVSVFRDDLKEREESRLPKYPETTTKHIGWLCEDEKFHLEKYGTEIKPISTLYKAFGWPLEGCP